MRVEVLFLSPLSAQCKSLLSAMSDRLLVREKKLHLIREPAAKTQLHVSELTRGSPVCVHPLLSFRLRLDAQIPSWIPTSPTIFRLPYPPQ